MSLLFENKDFISKIFHELRTPLTNVIGYSSLLKRFSEARFNEEESRQLTIIEESGFALQQLIDNFQWLYLLDHKLIGQDHDKLELNAWLSEFCATYAAKAQDLSLDWHLQLAGGHKIVIYTNILALERIMINLLLNALRYTSQGSISVALMLGQGSPRIIVKDSGCGISCASIDRVFERFYREDNQINNTSYSAGLGLAAARELADSLGYKLMVSDTGKDGTTFILEFNLP